MKKILDFIKTNIMNWLITVLSAFIVIYWYQAQLHIPVDFRDFKDGIQNHLLWTTKGECYFVKPQAEQTVYLVRVVDCDKK
jgi:hypothetical protein